MERVAVVGSSGSGKTTVAQAISARLDIPHLELDSIFHQTRWTPLPTGDFQDAVRTFTDQKAWVVDGNYTGQGITKSIDHKCVDNERSAHSDYVCYCCAGIYSFRKGKIILYIYFIILVV